MQRSLTNTAFLIASLAFCTACSISIDEKEESSDENPAWPEPTSAPGLPLPMPITDRGSECISADSSWYTSQYGSYFRYSSYQCYENDDYKWRTSCQSADCESLNIFVHYMLTEELGKGLTVNIEAFDNEQFSGYPKAMVTIQDFHAKTGEYDSADLYLEPGEYFLRAFVSNEESDPTPYPFGNMELVAGEPMGIYGALSGAEKIVIAPHATAEPVHIKLDKLFKKPGSEPDSRAHLRTIIKTDLHAEVATGRKIYIELFSDDDFEREAAHQFVMASEMLKIEGKQGEAEFVSPSLEVGNFYVRVYIDANDNKFFDAEELVGIHAQGDMPQFVRIQEKTVRSITIDLAKSPL